MMLARNAARKTPRSSSNHASRKASGAYTPIVRLIDTSMPGVVSFDRYYFAQQDKKGAILEAIDVLRLQGAEVVLV